MPDPASARLLGPADVRTLADRLGLRPTKRLGQNFVHDANTVRRIVRASGVGDADEVLEIGPGLGSLTLALLPVAARVHAVEIDPVLAGALPATVADRAPALADRLRVTTADAMRVRKAAIGEPTAVVANLPYNVAVPVLLHLLGELPSIRHGLVMVQAEVADRLAARPGSKVYGAPSAKLAWYADARRAGPVPRAVFWPVPGVDSGLLAFTRRDPPVPSVPSAASARRSASAVPSAASAGRSASTDRDATFAVVDAAFAQRRKALRSALAPWAGTAAAAEDALRAAGVDPLTRAERLDIGTFAAVAASAVPGT